MAYKCSFMDNGIYTAQDVNEMFSHLTSAGVVFFDTGNTIADLNETNSNIVSSGITNSYDSCRVINDNGVYRIGEGTCFMEDGSAITFDEEGAELEVTPGVYSYVYLKRSIPENDIKVMVSEEAPTGEYVKLAEIGEDGVIYDRRTYAKSKVLVAMPDTLKNFERLITPQELRGTVSVDIGTGDFSYFVIWGVKRIDGSHVVEYRIINQNLVPISDEEGNFVDTGSMSGGAPDFTINVLKDGQILNMSFSRYNASVSYEIKFGVI